MKEYFEKLKDLHVGNFKAEKELLTNLRRPQDLDELESHYDYYEEELDGWDSAKDDIQRLIHRAFLRGKASLAEDLYMKSEDVLIKVLDEKTNEIKKENGRLRYENDTLKRAIKIVQG